MSSDPLHLEHLRRTETRFGMRFLCDGDALDLTGLTVRAGLESNKSTASNTTAFKSFLCTAHGATGTISGTIPYTGVSFTGDATLRVWISGTPRVFIGKSHAVKIRDLSDNWIS